MDPNGKLDRVKVTPRDQASATEATYLTLEGILTEKYGNPTYTNSSSDAGIVKRIARWVFPSTRIEVSFTYLALIQTRNLVVMYDKNSGSDLDKM